MSIVASAIETDGTKRPKPASPTVTRRYHLGLDWGTSSTKLVLRDCDAPGRPEGLAFVVTHEDVGERYPSTVVVDKGALYFGPQAEARRAQRGAKVWDSLKANAAVKNGWAEAAGCDDLALRDLVTLSLAHYIFLAYDCAKRHAGLLDAKPNMALTLGAPEQDLMVRSREYLSAARLARKLAVGRDFDPQGKSVAECKALLHEERRVMTAPSADEAQTLSQSWLRAEVAAAMMWLFESPRIGEGPYTVIDIGGATTNASFFRVHGGHDPDGQFRRKFGMAFFGARSRAPGMDEFCAALMKASGRGTSVAQLRGREQDFAARYGESAAVQGIADQIEKTWADARRAAWDEANKIKHWEGLRYVVVGGGSKVGLLKERFLRPPGYLRDNLPSYRPIEDLGCPKDLRHLPMTAKMAAKPQAYRGDHTFLLVAYGLSFPKQSLPEFSLRIDIRPERAPEWRREFLTSAELGYDEK